MLGAKPISVAEGMNTKEKGRKYLVTSDRRVLKLCDLKLSFAPKYAITLNIINVEFGDPERILEAPGRYFLSPSVLFSFSSLPSRIRGDPL